MRNLTLFILCAFFTGCYPDYSSDSEYPDGIDGLGGETQNNPEGSGGHGSTGSGGASSGGSETGLGGEGPVGIGGSEDPGVGGAPAGGAPGTGGVDGAGGTTVDTCGPCVPWTWEGFSIEEPPLAGQCILRTDGVTKVLVVEDVENYATICGPDYDPVSWDFCGEDPSYGTFEPCIE